MFRPVPPRHHPPAATAFGEGGRRVGGIIAAASFCSCCLPVVFASGSAAGGGSESGRGGGRGSPVRRSGRGRACRPAGTASGNWPLYFASIGHGWTPAPATLSTPPRERLPALLARGVGATCRLLLSPRADGSAGYPPPPLCGYHSSSPWAGVPFPDVSRGALPPATPSPLPAIVAEGRVWP